MAAEYDPLMRSTLFRNCLRTLLRVWLGSGAFILLVFGIHNINQIYLGQEDRAWVWLLSHLLPSLTILLYFFFVDHNGEKVANRSIFRLALYLSGFYLVIVFLVILLAVDKKRVEVLAYLHAWNWPLAALQFLVIVMLLGLYKTCQQSLPERQNSIDEANPLSSTTAITSPSRVTTRKRKYSGKVSGEQIARLQSALLSAFPSLTKLKQFVRKGLNETLAHIAGGTALSEVAFNLIEWAEACGRLDELVEMAAAANPGNQQLQSFIEAYFDQEQVPLPASSSGDVSDGTAGSEWPLQPLPGRDASTEGTEERPSTP